jgi:hypothetical protein
MRLALVYVHPVGIARYVPCTRRFVATWQQHPPGGDVDLFVVCNGGEPRPETRELFGSLPAQFLTHDNRGWDIGAYQMAAAVLRQRGYDWMICVNATIYFHRPGWLRRMVKVCEANGPGMYGTHASYEHQPHIRTSFWWLPPALLDDCEFKVTSREQAFDFEYRRHCFTQALLERGVPCRLVTWDDNLGWEDWRRPANIYRRGTQRDCLVLDRHCDLFAQSGLPERHILGSLADGHRCYWGKAWLHAQAWLRRAAGAKPVDALPV